MFTLFAAKGTAALAVHIALEETGLPFETKWLTFADNDQRQPDYLAINPKGRVPALVTDDGIVTETPAILDYIADISGQLLPDTPYQRAKAREMMGYCAATFHVNHAHRFRGARWSDDPAAHASMAAKVPETMGESCAYVESQLTGDWVAGTYSIGDIHLFNICRWLPSDGVDIAAYPKLAAHFERVNSRPAVARATALHG